MLKPLGTHYFGYYLMISRNQDVTKSVKNANLAQPPGKKVHQNVRNIVKATGKLYAYGGKMFLLAMLIAKTK